MLRHRHDKRRTEINNHYFIDSNVYYYFECNVSIHYSGYNTHVKLERPGFYILLVTVSVYMVYVHLLTMSSFQGTYPFQCIQ